MHSATMLRTEHGLHTGALTAPLLVHTLQQPVQYSVDMNNNSLNSGDEQFKLAEQLLTSTDSSWPTVANLLTSRTPPHASFANKYESIISSSSSRVSPPLPAFSSLQPPCISYNEFPTELNPKFVDEDDEFMYLDELEFPGALYSCSSDEDGYLGRSPPLRDVFQAQHRLKSSPTLAELNMRECDDFFDTFDVQPRARTWRASDDDPLRLHETLEPPRHWPNADGSCAHLANNNRVLCNLLNSRSSIEKEADTAGIPINANRLRVTRNGSARNRNSSMSTEYSFSSSHDEGFASQAEDEMDEKEEDETRDVEDDSRVRGKTRARIASGGSGDGRQKRLKSCTEPVFVCVSGKRGGAKNVPEAQLSPLAACSSGTSRVRLSSKCSSSCREERSEEDDKNEDSSEEEDEDDESFYGEYEAKDLLGASTSDDVNNRWSLNMGRARKNCAQRYFWQYNVQSKGPKGTKLNVDTLETWTEGEECLPSTSQVDAPASSLDLEPLDPVFSPNCQIEGVKHAGKARRGDGNDLTPNPRKLLMIGLELKKLSKVINELTPVAEVPAGNKPNSRKEKNKLASRACRLKKKAQHEANKIKLHGLSAQQRKLLSTLNEVRRLVNCSGDNAQVDMNTLNQVRYGAGGLSAWLQQTIAQRGPALNVAGQSTEFVNSVLDEVSAGNSSGGLEKL